MSIDVQPGDRIEMSQRERDRLKVLHTVIDGKRSQAEAARLLRLSIRQVRRLQRRLQAQGDSALVHGLRGRPSNRRLDPKTKQRVLRVYRKDFADFGPTLASEKLAERGLVVSPDTLRRWLLAEGLWQRRRRRDPHRSRRPRRACFGELVQMDASVHAWTEGRGEEMVLITLIDDASNRLLARFYPAGTVETHFDLFGRWLRQYGRPLALYTDRHSIFAPQDKGRAVTVGQTQFGRALEELDIELIRAYSPQAKGRVERSFGTAQDRWVKELRLAKVRTCAQANTLLEERLLPQWQQRFTVTPAQARDAHRALGAQHNLAAILSIQERRVVANDYTIRFQNRLYQLGKPIWPGERGGKVIVELRLDGTMAIRFGGRYLNYHEINARGEALGVPPPDPRSLTLSRPTPEGKETAPTSGKETGAAGVQPAAGRSGRTPAEPYPPDGERQDSRKGPRRPAATHPWRRSFKAQARKASSGHF
jgi:transposase